VAATERGHEPGFVLLPAQRQPGQLQPGRPAFGAGRQCCHSLPGQVSADRFAQQRRGLVRGEAQFGGAQFGELAAGPQPR